jgi:hypothetical protein
MFLNLVLDDTMEDVGGGETVPIKTTVSVQIVSRMSCLFLDELIDHPFATLMCYLSCIFSTARLSCIRSSEETRSSR